MKNSVNILILITTLFLIGCSGNGSQVSPKEYLEWIENQEKGLVKTKTIGDVTYQIKYKTKPYIIIKKTNPENISSLNLSEEEKKYSDMNYFDFQIQHKNYGDLLKAELSSSEDYYLRLKYYSFELEKDIVLVSNGDTLSCQFSHFERTYGITPYINVVLAFPKTEVSSDLTVIYNDPIFNAGLLKFTITEENIKNIPSINTNKHDS